MSKVKDYGEPLDYGYDGDEWVVSGNYHQAYITDYKGAEEFAERITSCVNACRGLNPEAIPEAINAFDEVISGIERTACTWHEAHRERRMTDPNCARCNLDLYEEDVQKARKALAHLKGESVD